MAKKAVTRDQAFIMKVSPAEKAMLEKVADARGLSSSALVRMLVTDEARRLGIS